MNRIGVTSSRKNKGAVKRNRIRDFFARVTAYEPN
jgi:ribonuclease P protein component